MARRRLGPPSFIADLPTEAPAAPVQPAPLASPASDSALAAAGTSAGTDPRSAPLSPPAPAADAAPLEPLGAPSPRPAPRPPIASIAGQSSAEAALEALATDLRRARDEGRLVQELPLEAIDESHLVRDRILLDGDELEALKSSLRDRGQQMPIEVVDLGQGRFGLISGWRRLTALRQLAAEEPNRFGKVQALLRRPAGSAEAYRAMVEENEIRVGLSYYERARIAARAVGQGVFPDTFAALAGLFPTASRSKRSKIGSFIRIHDALDDLLNFPAAIPERLGLDLAKALEEATSVAALRQSLQQAAAKDAAAEQAALLQGIGARAGRQAKATATKPEAQQRPAAQEVQIEILRGRLILSGASIDAGFVADLKDWLAARAKHSGKG